MQPVPATLRLLQSSGAERLIALDAPALLQHLQPEKPVKGLTPEPSLHLPRKLGTSPSSH